MSIITCGRGCSTENKNSGRGCADPIETYVGRVLDTFEENGRDDSDFLAVVWDDDAQAVRTVTYASTRGWTYHNGAAVDATPEVEEQALAWYRNLWVRFTIEDAYSEATVPAKGDTVRSLTTRGANKGIEGEVKWVGVDGYDDSARYGGRPQKRYGIKVAGQDKLRYLNQDKVEMVEARPVDEAAIREAGTTARPANWRSALYVGLAGVLRG